MEGMADALPKHNTAPTAAWICRTHSDPETTDEAGENVRRGRGASGLVQHRHSPSPERNDCRFGSRHGNDGFPHIGATHGPRCQRTCWWRTDRGGASAVIRYDDRVRGACKGQRASVQNRRLGSFCVDRSRHKLDVRSLWPVPHRTLEGHATEAAHSASRFLVCMVAVSAGNAALHRAQTAMRVGAYRQTPIQEINNYDETTCSEPQLDSRIGGPDVGRLRRAIAR